MIILATVAINLAVDGNGLFRRAGDTANIWNNSVAQESSTMDNLLQIANTLGGTTPPPSALPEGWDANKVAATVKEGDRIAPIPKGYVASQIPEEKTIANGLVIYEGTAEVTGTKGSPEHEEAMKTRNQFVWIPVDDINYMVMCKMNNANGDGTVCSLELDNGKLRCMTHNATGENTTELCGRVYRTTSSSERVDGKTVYTYDMTFTAAERATQVWDTLSYREPDIVSDYDKDSNTSYLTAAGVSTASELSSQLTGDFVAMAESVAKYGGFYVARYEAGANGASKKDQQVMVAGTDTTYATGYTSGTYIEENNMWYGMYNKLRTSAGAVSSHMIWGCQYDMVISFLSEKASNDPFTGHTNRQLAAQAKTGTNSADVMSNVYDLEGNNYEWTAQANFGRLSCV